MVYLLLSGVVSRDIRSTLLLFKRRLKATAGSGTLAAHASGELRKLSLLQILKGCGDNESPST
jgi:hypothetical protein